MQLHITYSSSHIIIKVSFSTFYVHIFKTRSYRFLDMRYINQTLFLTSHCYNIN